MSATGRYVLRCFLVGVAALATSLQASAYGSSLDQAELINGVLAAIVAALAYAGIGAAIPSVEPNVGNKLDPPPPPG